MSNEKFKEQRVTPEHVAEALGVEQNEESQDTLPRMVETFYTREEIQAAPSAFGVDAEVLAGAMFGLEGEQLTRSQVTTAIEKFKTRKV